MNKKNAHKKCKVIHNRMSITAGYVQRAYPEFFFEYFMNFSCFETFSRDTFVISV